MKTIKVNLNERSYPIFIGAGLLNKVGSFIRKVPNVNSVLVVTNNKIKKLYGKKLAKSLDQANLRVKFLLVPDSEKAKSINIWIKAVRTITKFDKGKDVAVVAFGGGVVGDLAGFVAACYRRGVPLINVPTTLLAQVDSSIGGKTAVDLIHGKNLVGAFYQPKMVISDIALLKSLPLPEIKNGIAEIIKYGIILDKNFFHYLEKNYIKLIKLNKACLLHVVSICSKLKAKTVSADEKEITGYRSILNFGHTIGHALEVSASYSKKITHGSAVAIGMVCATDIARELHLLSVDSADRIEGLIKAVKLPRKIKALSVNKIFRATSYDKKIIAGKRRFVLPISIGHVIVCSNIEKKFIREAIKRRSKNAN